MCDGSKRSSAIAVETARQCLPDKWIHTKPIRAQQIEGQACVTYCLHTTGNTKRGNNDRFTMFALIRPSTAQRSKADEHRMA